MFWGVFEEIFSDARRPGTGGARMKEKPSKRWRNGRMAEWMDGGFRKSFSDEIFLRRISKGIELKFATIFSSVT